MLEALIFDVDGTLADTEMAHLAAFNHAFAQAGLPWQWDVALYTQLLEISGGSERIRAYWSQLEQLPETFNGQPLSDFIASIHRLKTQAYEKAVADGQVSLRPGVLNLIHEATDHGVTLAIATTTSPANIAALLHHTLGAHWQQMFAVIEDASTAPRKKPHPMVYQQALDRLGLTAQVCIAFEDSANGLRAANLAGLPTLVTPNRFTEHHDFSGAWRLAPSLEKVTWAQLQQWHAQACHAIPS